MVDGANMGSLSNRPHTDLRIQFDESSYRESFNQSSSIMDNTLRSHIARSTKNAESKDILAKHQPNAGVR